MLISGNTRQLNVQNLWDVEGENRSDGAFNEFVVHYERHNQSIVKALAVTYAGQFILCGLAMLFTTPCNVLAPAVLNHVITAFASPEVNMNDLSVWLGAYVASKIVDAFVTTQMNFYLELIALRLTVAIKALLYRKSLRRSIQSRSNSKTVDNSNLFSSDVDNVHWAAYRINSLWIIPVQIVVVVYILYDVIGLAAFAGLGVIAVSMLVSFVFAKISGDAFEGIMKYKDVRMTALKEVFNAIQVVKLNAWEDKFADKIHKVRATELSAVKKFMLILVRSIQKALTAARVFTAIALFNMLRDPLRELPTVIQLFTQAKISINRFADYLSLDEFNSANVARNDPAQPDVIVMAIEDGTFGWTQETALLNDLNLTVNQGDLVTCMVPSAAVNLRYVQRCWEK